MATRGEHLDIGADFDRDGHGGAEVDAGDRHQEIDPVPVAGQAIVNDPVVFVDTPGGAPNGVQVVVQEKTRVRIHRRRQSVAESLEMAPDMGRQRGEQSLPGDPVDESFEQTRPVGAEQLSEDDAHSRRVEDPVDAVA